MKHFWICEECEYTIDFEEPEKPLEDPTSELHDDRQCPLCDAGMYFDEYPDPNYKPIVIEHIEPKPLPPQIQEAIDHFEQFEKEFFTAHYPGCQCERCKGN